MFSRKVIVVALLFILLAALLSFVIFREPAYLRAYRSNRTPGEGA